ncbi:hypothetical protein PAXRUDRAFT_232341 [Paxillus rubicundulus Ve08.2h10]|uniref:Uncharacterized protein n=1 Tax=Paxillus rubicundulus Ve08.2h10 TaxID=930991 RepID=A0A0D0E701_9AGAM|nr:hypothetical protein PAXRUDRAFT_232341 [Paxillus rubicundulus Ve08.2h10]
MVVTRRAPAVPAPPLSRTHSSQDTYRSARSSVAQNSSSAQRNSFLPSVTGGQPTAAITEASNSRKDNRNGPRFSGNKSKKHKKHAKRKHQKSNFQAFLDFLTKIIVLVFTIYTFSVCPQDTHLQSPICRGLTEYKRIVLDPYVIPPLQAAFTHPSIAPHIERAKPYVNRAVEFTTPILLRTREEWNLRVVPQWERHAVPEWNNRVVPQWNKYVVPRWNKYVAPRAELLQAKAEFYRLRAIQKYEQRIAPRARVAVYNLQRWQRQAQPYVLLAMSKTQDGYYAAKPHAIPLAKRLGRTLQQFALFLQELRQKFLDPHVAKIWEEAKKLSDGKHAQHVAMPEPAVHQTSSEEPKLSHEQMFSTLGKEATATSDVDKHTWIPIEPTVTPTGEPTESFARPTDVETHLSAKSVVAESLHRSEPPLPNAAAFAQEHGASTATSSFLATDATVVTPISVQTPEDSPPVLVNTASPSSSALPLAAAELSPSAASVMPSKMPVASASPTTTLTHSSTHDEIDIDAFYAELGLNEPLDNASTLNGHNSILPSPPAETEEEKAERLRLKAEETARKRANIEVRHAKWEAELRVQMERSTAQLQSRLSSLRESAAADLASSVDVRNSIEELVTEAEKYIKGTEIYLRNLKGENRKSDEKLALWDRVVEKVGDKFTEHLLTTQRVVNDWYGVVLDKELHEVSTVTIDVRNVAEKGQVDLGLDYAWLEDVTYDDWQRYHALIGKVLMPFLASEQYAYEAASIQNGTHSDAPAPNPLTPILEDLESEVQDVVIGFETRLRRIKRDGERAFNNNSQGTTRKEEEKAFAVEPEAVPGVSILPIGEEFIISPVMIGSSQEEMLEAKTPSNDPDEAGSNLVQEAEVVEQHTLANADTLHTEL